MQGKIGLHGHEPSVGISSLSTELFREGLISMSSSSSSVRGSIWMGNQEEPGREESGELGGHLDKIFRWGCGL